MTQSSVPSSPVVAKQLSISAHLRRDIIEGKVSPGARLPTQLQLVQRFGVSAVTIQRVINRLIGEGFIRTQGRNGTFVSTHPPHLCSYGVVFNDRPEPGHHRSRYHDVLEEQAILLQRAGDRKVTIFNGISGHEDTEASRNLLGLVRSHQMAGLILIDGDVYSNTPLVDEESICRAAIMSCKVSSMTCPIIFPDMTGMIDLALDTLVASGRRRIATLITAPVYKGVGEYLRAAMRDRGITTYERWMQIVPHDTAQAVRNNVLLMMAPGQETPDGLFIVDDNLVEGAVAGLVDAGVKIPHDLQVIAHCNFPGSSAWLLPIKRVGFDLREMLEIAVNLIDTQRRGRLVPAVTRVAAILEESTVTQSGFTSKIEKNRTRSS
jgi:DNA-binding LacI/PurR family transcriptional regulator